MHSLLCVKWEASVVVSVAELNSVPGVGQHLDQTCAWQSAHSCWLMPEGEVEAVILGKFFQAIIGENAGYPGFK